MLSSFFKFCKDRNSVRVPLSVSDQKNTNENNTTGEQDPKPELNPRVANPPAANSSSNKPKIETPGSDPAEKQHSSDSDHDKNNGDGGNGDDHGESLGSNGGEENANDNIGIHNNLADNQLDLGVLHANTDANANLNLVNDAQENIVTSLNTTAGSPKVVTRSISPSPSFQSSASKSMSGRVRGTPKSDDVHSIASSVKSSVNKLKFKLIKKFAKKSLTTQAYKMREEANRRVSKAGEYEKIIMYVNRFIRTKKITEKITEKIKTISSYADAAGNSVAAARCAFNKLKVEVGNVEGAEKALLKAKAGAALQEVDKHLKDLTEHKDAARNSANNARSALGFIVENIPDYQNNTLILMLNWVDDQMVLVHSG
ncbi:hypothetical protein [Cardinium endosymbiont of Sogatella furcifera]|uniref:hypothetical protein n=1 Tax=Cardinium endosymbiont of Sogatella furcifera TaxID=650378 RepID=UPI0013B3B8C0|nr:hypothetical protein [Cardinium endosymbiont of Sogatella furcifera]